MPKRIELAWAAGFFDGEGSISVVQRPHRAYWYPLVQVGNKERTPIERFREIIGTGFIFTRRQDRFNMWIAASKKAEHALVQIIPYLVVKRRQAQLALLARKCYSDGRREIDLVQIAREIRTLNSKKGRRLPIPDIRE